MLEFISQPWHWSVSGVMIALVLFLMNWYGKRFGVSSNFKTICSIAGAGRKFRFFNFNWRADVWNLVFILGAVVGGFIAFNFLPSPGPVDVSEATDAYMRSVNVAVPQSMAEGAGFVPEEIFNFEGLMTPRGLLILVLGGFLVGFGTRYADGCTSGHAISGLANLQWASLVAVIGFFIGGLVMTHLILPQILTL
jgi:uncharacterized membrane protein YedE/YeeE